METATTRPWYKKKRYIVPLGLVGALFIGSAMSDTSTTAAPVSSYTPTVQQVNTTPLEKVTPQPTNAATVKQATPAASSDTPLSTIITTPTAQATRYIRQHMHLRGPQGRAHSVEMAHTALASRAAAPAHTMGA